jgi:Lsr2
MAQKVQTFLVDDLDGSDAEGTVLFGLDGTQYEIDLSAGHAKELRATLARYTDAGRKVTGTARRAGQNGRKAAAASISNTGVRTWAKARGLEVKDRGRVSADILAQYRAATGN